MINQTILQRTDATFGTYYYQQDHEGSVTHVTNAAGAVIESYRYDAFGAPTIKNGAGVVIAASAIGNRFMFTGREYAEKFGIYEYRARAYHPGLGRFMSEDPIGFSAGDYNLYRYCGNDPLDRVDPSGLVYNYSANAAWWWGSQLFGGTYDQFVAAFFPRLLQGEGADGGGAGEKVSFELNPISGNRNIRVDRIRDAKGRVTADIGRTDASLNIHAVPNGDNAVKIVADTKIDVLYADKVNRSAKELQKKEPDHYNEIKRGFYDVAATRVKQLNANASAFKSATAGLNAMESQLRKLFNTVWKESQSAHDNPYGTNPNCDHCYQGNPFLP